MTRQAPPKASDLLLQNDDNSQGEALEIDKLSSDLLVLETEQEAIADLPQEPQESVRSDQPQESRRSLWRWVVYSLLGLGVMGLVLPNFLNQTNSCGNKVRSSEGKTYVGTMNRGQQAFWLENGAFGKSIPVLGLGISEETNNYKYELQSFNFVSYQYAIPKNDKAKGFVGAVFVLPESSQDLQTADKAKTQAVKQQLATFTILCESPDMGVTTRLPKPFLQNGKPTCAEGTLLRD